jgi:cytochrome c oxidase assembly factor CtaG
VNTELSNGRPARPWLTAVGVALVVVLLVPPLSLFARRYLFIESIGFCVFAMAGPALVVLGTPLRRAPARLAGDVAANASRRRAPFLPLLCRLIAWVGIVLLWRLPPVLDQLARHPFLAVAEAATLGLAGLGLWLELVHPRAPAPRSGSLLRACAAVLAMWSIWVIAYVLGFAGGAVVHGYDGGGSHLLIVDDQEITAFVLWAAAAAAFLPVVFTAGFAWLRDAPEHPAEPAPGMPGTGVRGWGPPARSRRRTSAR